MTGATWYVWHRDLSAHIQQSSLFTILKICICFLKKGKKKECLQKNILKLYFGNVSLYNISALFRQWENKKTTYSLKWLFKIITSFKDKMFNSVINVNIFLMMSHFQLVLYITRKHKWIYVVMSINPSIINEPINKS